MFQERTQSRIHDDVLSQPLLLLLVVKCHTCSNPGNLLSPSVSLGLQCPTPRVWPCVCLLDFYPQQDDLRAWYDDCVSTKHLRGAAGETSCNESIKFVHLSSYVSYICKGLYKNVKGTISDNLGLRNIFNFRNKEIHLVNQNMNHGFSKITYTAFYQILLHGTWTLFLCMGKSP